MTPQQEKFVKKWPVTKAKGKWRFVLIWTGIYSVIFPLAMYLLFFAFNPEEVYTTTDLKSNVFTWVLKGFNT